MPKRGVIYLGMKLEPNPFISSGNIDESVYVLDYRPFFWQLDYSVMMIEIEVFNRVFIGRPGGWPFIGRHDMS